MTSRTDRLLCCAVAYHEAQVDEKPFENIAKDTPVENIIQNMMDIVWIEAKNCLSKSIEAPADPYLHTVDIDSSEPGIVSSKNKLEYYRRKMPLPSVTYEHRMPTPLNYEFKVSPDVSQDKALLDAHKKESKNLMKMQRKALKDIESDQRAEEKITEREEAKRKRKEETPEERNERLEAAREKRRKKKEEAELFSGVASPQIQENLNNRVEEEKEQETKKDILQEGIEVSVQELLEAEATDDKNNNILPTRLKARNRKTKFFASPVPFDRHLAALQAAWPSEEIYSAIVNIKESENVKIIQGPPGTGKTTKLLDSLQYFDDFRILLCANTNVGAANLYSRVVKLGYDAAILLPLSKIPPGTPILSQDPCKRIIASTIAGRSGPVLDNQKFDVIFLDEAAQCIEPWLWGLLRKEVKYLSMTGDIHQLPALVSDIGQKMSYDRSAMQRLIENNYPYTSLKIQRRMHPEIVQFPNYAFYDNELETEYKKTSDNSDILPYEIIHVDSQCENSGTSFSNIEEAKICIKEAESLSKLYNDVVIITPYQAQCRYILSCGTNIPIHTVDSFQGREANVVILSIVRTGEAGFWEDDRRLVVALTRARHVMRIVGNTSSWKGKLSMLYENGKERDMIRMRK